MKKVALVLAALLAALHFYIAWFEMFIWTIGSPKLFDTFQPALVFIVMHSLHPPS